jgi:hypothetical protein
LGLLFLKIKDMKATETAINLYHIFYDTSHHQNSVQARSEIAAKCVIATCNTLEKELQGHSDLHGYWQDDTERMSIVQRIAYWRSVKKEAERLWSVA